jgi:hypothetical protein
LYPRCPLCTHKPWCCIIFGFQQFSFHRDNISVHSHSIVGYTPICSRKPQVDAMAGSGSSLVRGHCHFSLPEACFDCAGGSLRMDVPWWMINFYV